ncbi:MAG: ribose-phosphate pyrophosphokinase [Candidatus Firestonebacteria bacterium RifOxyC12_full_39_7]|nr:MAG: ribose-phosphate pyrophosphokinase [Candidatus Firestonebacteria bacterium RifOxyC12_full_39_7]
MLVLRNYKLKVFGGSANPELVTKICKYLHTSVGKMELKRFPDGETWVKIADNVRGADCFVVQPTCMPTNENLVELFLMIDAFKRSSARRITVVIPYYAYARQDRKDQPRVAISAKLIANLLTSAGASRIIAMDLHAAQVQGFFDIPVDHLIAEPVLAREFAKKKIPNLVIAASDMGGSKMARSFAERLGTSIAIVDKRRHHSHKVEALSLIGDVAGKNVLIPDDMISTAGTMVEAARFLQKHGAKDIYACCTHPVFSGSALEKIENSVIKEVMVTDTIPLTEQAKKIKKIKVITVS